MMLIADWITLSPEVARSLFVTSILFEAFWPLTIVVAIGVFVWWRNRSAVFSRVIACLAVVLWLPSAATYFYYVGGEAVWQTKLRSRQQTLQRTEVIAGIVLPAGTLVTYSPDRRNEIESIDLKEAASVYGIPLIRDVNFQNGHPDGYVTLDRDAMISGVPCSAQADVQIRDGALDTCTLSHPSRVRDIPCRGEVSLSIGTQCVLASDYQRFGVTWRAGTNVSIDGNAGSFDIMAGAPNLYLLGLPLPSRAVVEFDNRRLSGVNLTNSTWRFRGCLISDIKIQNGSVSAQPIGECKLPKGKDGYAMLPANALTVR
jgi:hypothetical protein